MSAIVLALCVSSVREVAPGKESSIDKRAIGGRLAITRLGLACDTQTDRSNHGGEHMAVHHYPANHYPYWREELPGVERLALPGAFGENLHAEGLTESVVHIGDRFRLGNALLEVSMGRQPCVTLQMFFKQDDMIRRIIANGRCGWYYRVIEEGSAIAGDRLELMDSPHPEWSVARAFDALFSPTRQPARSELADLLALPALSPKWRSKVALKMG